MSNTQDNDARVDLGYCDLKLTEIDAQYGPDETRACLGCWGLYVVRASFAAGDDQRVAGAMSKLDSALAMTIKEMRSLAEPLNPGFIATDAEVMRRFHNILIDDAQLHDATIDEVRSYVLSNLDRLPDSFTLNEWSNLYFNKSYEWVKFVDVEDHWLYRGHGVSDIAADEAEDGLDWPFYIGG
ncbi:hypothetical protein NQ176_g1275 [Zarea fungicola]|uniref:Uncharacterized protein n=1 Tax=Zarea fungicola TaxID=93591 RepID=A0ACC1NVL5_9HYPO|nr:hypothetical protein NQ176_g1275 [Lecanicillium fungicola]